MIERPNYEIKITKLNKTTQPRRFHTENDEQPVNKKYSIKLEKSKQKPKNTIMESDTKPDLLQTYAKVTSDRQKLSEELIQTKKKMNILENENHVLKTKLKIYEADINRFKMQDPEKLSQTMMSWKMPNLLKQELRRCRQHNQTLQIDLENLKKTVKASKYRELEIYAKNLEQEVKRLKAKIDLMEITFENRNNDKQAVQYEHLIDKLRERDREVTRIRMEFNNYKVEADKQSHLKISEFSDIVKRLKIEIDKLKKNHVAQEKQEKIAKTYQQHKPVTVSLNRKKKSITVDHPSSAQKNPETATTDTLISQNLIRIGEFMSYKFRAHRILQEQIYRYLVPQNLCSADGRFLKDNLANILGHQPFELHSINDKIELIEYLFNDQFTNLKKEHEASVSIKKRFQQILPIYHINEISFQDRLFVQVCELVHKHSQTLAERLSHYSNSEATIRKQQLVAVLQEFKFPQNHIKFMIIQISLDSINLNYLNFYSIFELFNQNLKLAPQQINPVQEVSEEEDECSPANHAV